MTTKYYPYYGGNFDRIVFDGDGSVWVPDAKLREVESENASLRGAAQGLGELCDRYKAENAELVKRNEELQADVIRLFLKEAGKWIECKQREMEEGQ